MLIVLIYGDRTTKRFLDVLEGLINGVPLCCHPRQTERVSRVAAVGLWTEHNATLENVVAEILPTRSFDAL